MPKNPMPQKEKIMKKMKKALEKNAKEKPKVDLSKLATELSERREDSLSREKEEVVGK